MLSGEGAAASYSSFPGSSSGPLLSAGFSLLRSWCGSSIAERQLGLRPVVGVPGLVRLLLGFLDLVV